MKIYHSDYISQKNRTKSNIYIHITYLYSLFLLSMRNGQHVQLLNIGIQTLVSDTLKNLIKIKQTKNKNILTSFKMLSRVGLSTVGRSDLNSSSSNYIKK